MLSRKEFPLIYHKNIIRSRLLGTQSHFEQCVNQLFVVQTETETGLYFERNQIRSNGKRDPRIQLKVLHRRQSQTLTIRIIVPDDIGNACLRGVRAKI